MTPERVAHYMALWEFAVDVASPEGYGHAMPPEVIRRAAQLAKLFPKEVERPAPAQSPPP